MFEPSLDAGFLASDEWTGLSKPAQSTLEGLIQFVTRHHCDWVVEGTPKQLASWIGPELDMTDDMVAQGLRELDDAGCIKRSRTSSGRESRYVLRPSIVAD